MRSAGMMVAAVATVGAARAPIERVIPPDGIVAARIAGIPVRIRVDPAAPAMPLIRREIAERAGLKMTGSWGIGIGYSVGGVGVMTRTQAVQVDWGSGAAKRRVGWSSRPFAAIADGSVGPDALPEPVVRFGLHPPQPGERDIVLPTTRDGALLGLFGNFSATYAMVSVDGQPLRIRIDPYHPRTLATAGAARRLATTQDGIVTGRAVPTEILFGIERPVRTLTLRRPLAIGSLRIADLGVRVRDDGTAPGLGDADAAPVDPDEIVVVGKAGKRDIRHDILSLGADVLSACSTIVFDRGARTITLRCR